MRHILSPARLPRSALICVPIFPKLEEEGSIEVGRGNGAGVVEMPLSVRDSQKEPGAGLVADT